VSRPLLVVAAVLAAGDATANPLDAFGFGARAGAMGGAQTAATIDGGANYYNQAALAVGDDIRIDVGYQAAKPFLSINDNGQGVDSSRGLAVGVSAPGKIGPLRLAFGLGVFLPDDRITRARAMPAGRPRWSLYDNRPQRLFIASNLAFELHPRVHVGAGIAYMSRTKGDLNLNGRVGFPNSENSDLETDINVDLKTIRYAQAGILVKATPWLDVGFSYRGGFVLELDQTFAIRGDLGSPGVEPIISDAFFALQTLSQDLFQPETFTLGVAMRVTPRLLLAADLAYQRWGKYRNPAAKIVITYDLGMFNDLVELPPPVPLPEAHFHDIMVVRLGAEWTAATSKHLTWQIRGGYSYEPSPAPEQQGETNFVDNDKHTLSAGLGVSVARVTKVLLRPFDIDLYLSAGVLPERKHRKLSEIDPVGDYTAAGVVFAAGVSTRWHF
jgi:Outer membrane protein transport protein (OMPP1/FadL/TodX)